MERIKKGDKLWLTHSKGNNFENGMKRLDTPIEKEVSFISTGWQGDNMIHFVGGGGISDDLIGKVAFRTRDEAEEALSWWEED